MLMERSNKGSGTRSLASVKNDEGSVVEGWDRNFSSDWVAADPIASFRFGEDLGEFG